MTYMNLLTTESRRSCKKIKEEFIRSTGVWDDNSDWYRFWFLKRLVYWKFVCIICNPSILQNRSIEDYVCGIHSSKKIGFGLIGFNYKWFYALYSFAVYFTGGRWIYTKKLSWYFKTNANRSQKLTSVRVNSSPSSMLGIVIFPWDTL